MLVEQLAQQGLLKVICGTDTLGVGINVPIRTVLFTRLCKFDGQKTAILSARDFHQIAGRAGRKGFDDRGFVVAQAPEHVIENLQLGEKAQDGKKVVKRKPPEQNFVNWDQKTFKRLMAAPPERLISRFQVSHGMLLNVLSRRGDGCRAMQRLIRDCHEPDRGEEGALPARLAALPLAGRARHRRDHPADARRARGSASTSSCRTTSRWTRRSRCTCSRRSRCSTPSRQTYALDLLTLVESILENPDLILRKQLDKLKDQKIAEMKTEGIEYDQRMEELEKLEYPKPQREFVYSTFNAFADRHPWVGEENIRPKSIAREMFEGFRSFSDYIHDYELQRAEGLLLRHLNSVYKVLSQTVPDGAKTDAVREMELYLRDMLRQVDSSLLDEWEKMRDPSYRARGRRTGSEHAAAAARGAARTSRATPRRSPPPSARASSRSCAPGPSAHDEAALEAARLAGRRRRRAVDGRAAARGARGLPRRARAASASTPRPATSATPTSMPVRRPARRGACSRCSWTRRGSTTGWRSSRWTSPPRASRASRCSSCCASAAWRDPAYHARRPKTPDRGGAMTEPSEGTPGCLRGGGTRPSS